ncbi:MAG: hypothetical protein HYY79_02335 [Betaproteobacteria bacterium]|nr:hypothetical protein [Betaproteobacteria bacterium]
MSNRTLLLVAGIVVGSVWGLAVGAAYGASGCRPSTARAGPRSLTGAA